MSKMADFRTLWEAYPRSRDYMWLEPSIRKVADWTREGLLTEGGSLLSVFEDKAKVVMGDANNIRHKLYIEDNDLRATVMKVDFQPNQKVGVGRSEFYLWVDTEWYDRRALVLLDSAQEAPMLVRHAEPDGHLWRLTLVLTGNGYVDAADIKVGDMMTQIGAARGEAADERGPVHIGKDNSYIEFSTPKTRFGWEFPVTDDAWKAMQRNNEFFVMRPENKGDRNRENIMSTNLLDMKFLKATDRHMDLWLTYGKAAGQFAGAYLDRLTNKHFNLGPGFYEWMQYSKIDYFNPASFSIPYLGNIMTQRWHNNIRPEDREVDFGTGTLGLKWFHEACIEYGLKSSYEPFEIDNERVNSGHDGMRNGVVVNKKQYVGAFIPQFGRINVHYLPHLDDDRFEKGRYKGYSKRSGEFLALDTGFGNGADSNIYLVKDDSENGFGYGIGLWTPFGPAFNNAARVNGRWPTTEGSKNQYKLIRDEACTIVVKDPSAIMWLKPAIK